MYKAKPHINKLSLLPLDYSRKKPTTLFLVTLGNSTSFLITNYLAYRYRYRSKFYGWLLVFLEKRKLPVGTKTLLLVAGIFLVVIFLFPCDIVVISLSYLSSDDGSIFFCFSFCGTLGLLLCFKSKKHKGSDALPGLITISPNCMHICQNFWLNGRRVTRGGRGEVSPALFEKLEKSTLICGNKCPNCGHLWVKFSFKMQFLRVSRRKNWRLFPRGAFLSCILGQCLSKCPNSKKTRLP